MLSNKVSPAETGMVHGPEGVDFSGTRDTASLGRPSSLRLQDHTPFSVKSGSKSHPESEGSQIKDMEEKVMINEHITHAIMHEC